MISFSFLFRGRHTLLLTCCCWLWACCTFGQAYNDLSLDAFSSVSIAAPGDTISFYIQVKNEGQTSITGLSVKNEIPAGAAYWQHQTPAGTSYDPVTGIWQLENAMNAATSILEMELQLIVNSNGVIYNQAEVFTQNEMDVDSEPGNSFLLEDDVANACTSIPFSICPAAGETVTMMAPEGYSGYVWYRDSGGGPTVVGNGQSFTTSQPGNYHFTTDNAGCPTGLCCPIIVEEACGQIMDTTLMVFNCEVTDPFFCMDIPYADLSNYSFEVNGLPYTDEFGTCNYQRDRYYSFGALLAAGGQGPYHLENWSIAGNLYSAEFQTIEELVAWMNQWDIFGEWTVNVNNQTISGGNPQIYYGKLIIRQLSDGTVAILDLYQQFTSSSTYLNLPEGNSQVVVTNHLTGSRDSFNIRVICVTPDYVELTMPVGTLDTVCLSTDELEGAVAGIFNACGENIITAADLDIIAGDICVEVVALEPGETDACYVICDELGICDTTYIHITVIDDNFTLNPDTLCTAKNVPVIGEVLLNDIIPDSIISITIITPPQHGSVIVNPDGTLTYVPEEDYCNDDGPLDQFVYQVCTGTGCQSTLVFVKVMCDGLIVYNGFSPNGDGVNDVFRIDGLGVYPNHNIMVFNRWGNKVFETRNYRNDWDGYWDGKRLPFGTYFYLIDLGDGSKWLSGYLQIWW